MSSTRFATICLAGSGDCTSTDSETTMLGEAEAVYANARLRSDHQSLCKITE